tara:strand:+ start:312 stop:542 length:231 start_codon:yes stop_codon:yes gene_type:complete
LKAPDGETPPLLAFYLHYRGGRHEQGRNQQIYADRKPAIRANWMGRFLSGRETLEILLGNLLIGEQKMKVNLLTFS